MNELHLGRAIARTLTMVPRHRELIRRARRATTFVAALFHEIAPAESPLTLGLGVTYTPTAFERWLEYCSSRYEFVTLDELQQGTPWTDRYKRRMLLTFDDAYASVAHVAAPICAALGVQSVFFVNTRFLDNRELALDNLVAAVVNLKGMEPIVSVAGRQFGSVDDVISNHVARLDLASRQAFHAQLQEEAGIAQDVLLEQYRPYLTTDELRRLPALGMEIGNHTTSHVHTRILEGDGVRREITDNRAALEAIVGSPVRAFAYPYGRSRDATPAVATALTATGHRFAFLVGGRLNDASSDPLRLHRVSVRADSAHAAFAELEVLPLLREMRGSVGSASGEQPAPPRRGTE